jgi:hypothetical protein
MTLSNWSFLYDIVSIQTGTMTEGLGGFRRQRSLPNQGTIPEFIWRDSPKPHKTSVSIAVVPTAIQTEQIVVVVSATGRPTNPVPGNGHEAIKKLFLKPTVFDENIKMSSFMAM